jgi:flagellar export protein FliJ
MVFRFNLERVLQMRKDVVDEAASRQEEVLQAVERTKSLLQEELKTYFAERESFNDAARQARFHELSLLERALELRKKRLMEVVSSLRELEEEARLAERALILARKDHKAVDNLKEKRAQEYLRAQEEKERKFLDEMTVLQHARRAREEQGT